MGLWIMVSIFLSVDFRVYCFGHYGVHEYDLLLYMLLYDMDGLYGCAFAYLYVQRPFNRNAETVILCCGGEYYTIGQGITELNMVSSITLKYV